MKFQFINPEQYDQVRTGIIYELRVDDSCVFAALESGAKSYEWRKEDDRVFALGDIVRLVPSWGVITPERFAVPASKIIQPIDKLVVSILRGPAYGVPDGFAILGLVDVLDDGFEDLFRPSSFQRHFDATDKHLDVLFNGGEITE